VAGLGHLADLLFQRHAGQQVGRPVGDGRLVEIRQSVGADDRVDAVANRCIITVKPQDDGLTDLACSIDEGLDGEVRAVPDSDPR
jgi:hypothetical protein